MAAAGYSGTPLGKKLGIKPSQRILLINAPSEYNQWIREDISKQIVTKPPADFVHIFETSAGKLRTQFTSLIKKLPADAVIWLSWYKKSAKMETDITEDLIRTIVLPTGWVDVKVCAVSEQWSGLKIVKRLAGR